MPFFERFLSPISGTKPERESDKGKKEESPSQKQAEYAPPSPEWKVTQDRYRSGELSFLDAINELGEFLQKKERAVQGLEENFTRAQSMKVKEKVLRPLQEGLGHARAQLIEVKENVPRSASEIKTIAQERGEWDTGKVREVMIAKAREQLRKSGDYRMWIVPMYFLDLSEKHFPELQNKGKEERAIFILQKIWLDVVERGTGRTLEDAKREFLDETGGISKEKAERFTKGFFAGDRTLSEQIKKFFLVGVEFANGEIDADTFVAKGVKDIVYERSQLGLGAMPKSIELFLDLLQEKKEEK